MTPQATHPDYDASAPDWSRARAVLAGEDAVKAAGEKYLPRLASHTNAEYEAYLRRVSFFNATARTAEGFVGLIFRRPPFIKLPEDRKHNSHPVRTHSVRSLINSHLGTQGTASLPAETSVRTQSPASLIDPQPSSPFNSQMGTQGTASLPSRALDLFLNDADMQGTTLDAYSKTVVTEVVGIGRAGSLVDWEPAERRAFVKLYQAEQIMNWRMERINGRSTLALVVLSESAQAIGDNEFSPVNIPQLRVLKLVPSADLAEPAPSPLSTISSQQSTRVFVVEQWQLLSNAHSNKPAWTLVDTRIPMRLGKPLANIPFVFHGPRHSRPNVDRPPLTDILTVNLDHYRLNADYKHGLHFTALPTAWVSGFDKSSELKIGSSTAWVAEDPGATAGFLEFTGQGLTTFERAMDRDERLMAVLGSRLLEDQKKVGESAEAIQLRQSGENSILSAIVTSVSQSLTQVLRWVYWWNSTAESPSSITSDEAIIQLNNDFSLKGMSSQDLQAVVAAWQSGAISLDTMFELFRKGEILPDGRTNEEEATLISRGGKDALRVSPINQTNLGTQGTASLPTTKGKDALRASLTKNQAKTE